MTMRHRWGGAITLVLTSSMLCASAPALLGQRVDSTTGSRQKTDTPGTESGHPEADPTTEQPENSKPAGGFKDWIAQRVRSLTSTGERERGITVEVGTV